MINTIFEALSAYIKLACRKREAQGWALVIVYQQLVLAGNNVANNTLKALTSFIGNQAGFTVATYSEENDLVVNDSTSPTAAATTKVKTIFNPECGFAATFLKKHPLLVASSLSDKENKISNATSKSIAPLMKNNDPEMCLV
ncbi:MAG: hypothetical protein Tsb005_21540 [Gammaproteobacteria bacterium]